MNPAEILFVGLGATAVCYYRVLLPAHELGCDYVGIYGDPPDAHYATGLVRGQSRMPDFTEYRIVVLQQPKGRAWLEVIRALQERGTIVCFEVDDWLHAIGSREDHAFKDSFTKADLAEYERCMRACDALIVSTPFLFSAYRPFNKRVFLCPNGIDLRRYELTRPMRETVTIGWAGATGHGQSVGQWVEMVADVMDARPATRFTSIGRPFGELLDSYFPGRVTSVPWAAIEQYPAAMTALDVALAPGGSSGFQRAKSDLRFLEAGALGIPLIAHPAIYPDIKPRVTGFHARSASEMKPLLLELVDDGELRTTVGENARRYIREHRTIGHAAQAWRDTFDSLLTDPPRNRLARTLRDG